MGGHTNGKWNPIPMLVDKFKEKCLGGTFQKLITQIFDLTIIYTIDLTMVHFYNSGLISQQILLNLFKSF